jgi:hypothetical protein
MATITVTPIKTFVSGETVTPTKLNELAQSTVALTAGTIVDADVSAGAAIAFSKLAPLDDANILVGNGSNVATKVAVTGDVTISNAGVTAIGAAKVLPTMLAQKFTLDTAKASTSGTSIDFPDIPSWAKRITVMFDKVSTNGSSFFLVQLGDAGGFETSGYESFLTAAATTVGTDNTTAGFRAGGGIAARSYRGIIQICLLSGNTWVASGTLNDWNANNAYVSGSKALSDTLTQVRFTTVNGTDTFDAGSINISYEG